MKVGIHQPQYIPWPSYFLKINSCEIFIILDSVSYQKNGLQNRNRINTSNGVSWLTVPIIRKQGQKIIDTKIDNSLEWRKKHWMTIYQNYNKSNFFKNYSNQIELIYKSEWQSLASLNLAFIELIMDLMNIKTKIILSSTLDVKGSGSDLVLNLCKTVNAKKYISGIGAKDYLIESEFRESNIDIVFLEPKLPTKYIQNFKANNFINDLSVLDLLFNCGDNWINHFEMK